ncbi:hypothetical protein L0666_14860 [Octadecabacter sp. CECT 8868]|nr:hypothetical protein [Octadecabacter algicola]
MVQGSEGDDLIDGVTGEDGGAEQDYLNGSEGNDTLIGNDGDVMSGGDGTDRFEVENGLVSIMDYTGDDVLVVKYDDAVPTLTTQLTENGLLLLADGDAIAELFGVASIDVDMVQLMPI